MTLRGEYERTLAAYERDGHGEDSWQFLDEGRVFAIQGYLSSCGELTDEDWAFAREKGIEEECRYELDAMFGDN